MADTRMLVGIVLSLLISSLAISFVTGDTSASLGDIYIYEPIDTILNDTSDLPGMVKSPLTAPFSKWNITDIGLISDSTHPNSVIFINHPSRKGLYENTYGIINNDNRPYTVIIRRTNWLHDSLQAEVYHNKIVLQSRPLYGYISLWNKEYPFDMSVYGTTYNIKTELDEIERTIKVYVNDNLIAIANDIPKDSILSFGDVGYSGIEVTGKGFIINKYQSIGTSANDESFSIWNFVSSLANVLAWYTGTGNVIVDLFVNLIIKIQQFAIGMVIVTILRGN